MRIALAALHLLALGIGLGAVFARSRALRAGAAADDLRRAFAADAWWGAAAALWISTGLWRWLAGTEKAASYYMQNPAFHAKLGLFLLVFALEVWPMLTLIRWRRGASPTPAAARRIATISALQAAIVVAIVVLAAAMARGVGA